VGEIGISWVEMMKSLTEYGRNKSCHFLKLRGYIIECISNIDNYCVKLAYNINYMLSMKRLVGGLGC
jgi:hypothetical protein